MAHPEQMFFIENVAKNLPAYFTGKKVLEVGSLNINGTVRGHFTHCDYLGIDVAPGKDVDQVVRGEDLQSPDHTFDVVISSEMFEHNKEWKKCLLNMIRVLKPEGLMVFTCATLGRRQHGTKKYDPHASPLTVGMDEDYYKNLTQKNFMGAADFNAAFSMYSFMEDRTFSDLYFFGLGKQCPRDMVQLGVNLGNAFNEHYYKKNVLGEF